VSKGVVAQVNHANGNGWQELYMPGWDSHIKEGADRSAVRTGCLHMNGREVFKFAVTTFCALIQETLDKAGLKVGDVDMFVCHQSNIRIIDAAIERFGINKDNVYVNIERFGNTSAGSVPLLRRAAASGPGPGRPACDVHRVRRGADVVGQPLADVKLPRGRQRRRRGSSMGIRQG
jgi:3-oxoacyl-[acyl-carrier-protein] synthase III